MSSSARGLSIHIGVNEVDPEAYDGWSGPLAACEYDAKDLLALAEAQGLAGKLLLTKDAKRARVREELERAAKTLQSGDLLLLTYSGHGGQVPDKNRDEKDFYDETWCLFDGQLIDDELYDLWASFQPDVRIVVLSDSCHSGTAIRVAPTALVPRSSALLELDASGSGDVYRARSMPTEVVARAYRAQRKLYDDLQNKRATTEGDIRARVLLISGCQDSQTSLDGPFNGAFTAALLRTWNEGTFKGNYRLFHKKIQRQLPATQQPNLMTLGHAEGFVLERPFTL